MSLTIEDIMNLLPESLPPDPSREHKISHVGRIDRLTAQVLTGIFTGLAIIAVVFRITIHLRKRGKLFIDDLFVTLAAVALLIETGLIYYNYPRLYIELALTKDPKNIALFDRHDLESLNHHLDYVNAWIVFAWATIFLIKLSFLALFYGLVRNVSRPLVVLWWTTLVASAISWFFLSFENMINCGVGASKKCYPRALHNFEIALAATITDVVSDVMIILIPILLLRQSQLRRGQKYRILTFLCLSIFMVAVSIIRLGGSLYRDNFGDITSEAPWAHFWLNLEASIAVLMGGISAFRTVFSKQIRDGANENSEKSYKTLYSRLRSFFQKSSNGGKSTVEGEAGEKARLPAPLTSASFKGLRTFIRRHDREPGSTTVGNSTLDNSVLNSAYDPLESYHNFHREGCKSDKKSGNTTSVSSGSTEDWESPRRPMPVLQTHNMV